MGPLKLLLSPLETKGLNVVLFWPFHQHLKHSFNADRSVYTGKTKQKHEISGVFTSWLSMNRICWGTTVMEIMYFFHLFIFI